MAVLKVGILMVLSAAADPMPLTGLDVFRRLQGDLQGVEPMAPLRKLQSIPQACLDACPKMQAYQADMLTAMSGLSDMSKLGDAIGSMMGKMCNHKEAMTCAASEASCQQADAGSNAGLMSMADPLAAASAYDCICDACPGAMEAVGGMMGSMLGGLAGLGGLGGQESTTTLSPEDQLQALLTATCPMITPMECMSTHSKCTALAQSMNLNEESMASMIAMKSQCEASGIPTSPESTDSGGPVTNGSWIAGVQVALGGTLASALMSLM
eukprot:TRINITY_DN5429_c0_g1_i1.p1 TRINITY_DN5429_c0_g1~~TRINITY_DN5429_c0_g1_i1.p1  ORF type:complete len:292 (+),score=41.84 TRINITY_DN5429_c0_g1_i1:73-876(+)